MIVNGTPHGKYSQYYSYSYNPCSWLSLAGDCQRGFETAVSNDLIIFTVIDMKLDVFGVFVVLGKSGYLSFFLCSNPALSIGTCKSYLFFINNVNT